MLMNRAFKLWLLVLALAGGLAVLPSPVQADGCSYLDNSLSTYGASVPNVPRYCNTGQVTRKVINIAFALIGGVSLVFLIIGGFRYMTAGGSEEQVTAGKKTALYALAGLVVVILAVTIVNVVINLILFGRTF